MAAMLAMAGMAPILPSHTQLGACADVDNGWDRVIWLGRGTWPGPWGASRGALYGPAARGMAGLRPYLYSPARSSAITGNTACGVAGILRATALGSLRAPHQAGRHQAVEIPGRPSYD